MSTPQRVNFEPVSDLNSVTRRDFPLANPDLSDPTNPLCLVDGEWMMFDNTVGPTNGKIVRATDVTTPAAAATTICFALFAERGRYDVRALSGHKMPLLFMGQYEFNTRIFDAAAVVGAGGAAIASYSQPVKVATIVLGGRNYTGLVGSAYTDNAPIVGYVTRLPAGNGGMLRFLSGGAVRNGAT